MQTNFWSMQPLWKIQKQIHELFSCCWQKDKIQTAFAQGTRKLINTIQKERNRLVRSNISYRPYANVEYEKIYKKVVEMDPSMEEFIDEVREMMGEIGGRGMGYLFENMEKMDIQAERRNTQREKERADMEKELEKRMHVTGN